MLDPIAPLSLSSSTEGSALNDPESSLTAMLAQTQIQPSALGGMDDPSYQVLESGLQVTDLQTALIEDSWEALTDTPMMTLTSLNTVSEVDAETTTADTLLGTVGVASPLLTLVDDFAGDTSTTGSVTIGGSRTGVVEASNDRDWFRVSLTAGRSYRFNLNGNTLSDTTLVLRNGSGTELAFNDDVASGNLNSQIAYTATATGTYYLDAGAYGSGTGSYTLLAVDTTPADDFTANTNTTGSVAIGSSRTGVVNVSGDRDWFRVSLTAGRSYRFRLNGNTLSDPALALRNGSGTELAFNDDANGGLNSQITYTATTTGTYYLDAGAYGSGTGSYTLLAVDTTPTDDFTANTNTTGSVAIGGSRTGVVNVSGDRDWFRVSLTAGNTYRFRLNGNTLADPTLYLRNASGTQLAFNDDFNERNSQITYTATTTGTYYLDAGAYSTGLGSYTVLAALVDTPTPITDDFTANTRTVGSVAIGGSRAGVINFNGDRDWFRVSLAAGSTYRFNLNGNTLSDPTLALRNGSGTQLAFNDDFNGRNSQITYTATTTGTYYLDAGAYSTGLGSYNLLASLVNTPVPSTDDFAGNTTTTGSVAVGGSRTGVVNSNGDRDWIRISLTAGRTYRFTVESGSLIDPDLYLRGSGGGRIAYSEDSGGSSNPIITFTCATTGTYYLDVGSANNVGVGSYTLRAADLLPNDDFAANTSTTGSLTVGGSRTGVVNFSGDRDWFAIALAAGQTYRFNLNGNTLGDPTLYLRDANGSQLAFSDDFNNSVNSQITYTATSAGTYYLDAGAYGSGTGSYALTAANATPSNDDYKADTTTTGTVAVGQQASGAIEFVGDRDWFRVSLTAGRTYRFNLNGNTLSNPILSLWNSAGSNVLASNDNFGNGLDSQLTFTANTTGAYFLDAGASASLMGTYTLAATDVTPNDPGRIPGLQNASIRTLVNTALGDNLFTHQELSSLLRSTATNGVTATEFADLGRISSNLSPYLNSDSRSYTQYIFNAVVNGNTANQWWTGGGGTRGALGNLVAGATQQHLNRLVDKWFGGLDLPTNFVGGDSAAGASSLTFNYGQMTGSLFVNGISFSDINQGQAGTCYFLAAASTLANNQSQFIQNMFLNNGDGTYGVRFYGGSGNEIWVTVNRSVPVLNGNLVLAGNSTASLGGEMWVALAEKAYAQANEIGQFGRSTTANSYRQIEGGWEEALRHISNRPTTTFSSYYTDSNWTSANNNLTTWNSYLSTAIAAVNAGRSLWLGSFGNTYDSAGKRNLVSGHAFAITGYNASTQRFTIANPWGPGGSTYAGVFEATWGQLFSVRGVVSWA